MKPKGGRAPNSPKTARDLRLQAQDALLRPPPDCGGGGGGQQKGSRKPCLTKRRAPGARFNGHMGVLRRRRTGSNLSGEGRVKVSRNKGHVCGPPVGPCSHSRSSKTTGEGLPVGAGAVRLASGNAYPAPERALLEAAQAVGRAGPERGREGRRGPGMVAEEGTDASREPRRHTGPT